MSQLIQFLGTWFGAFFLGLWIPGAIFYGDKYKVFDFKKPWLDVIRDIIATVLWPVPFIVDMIKRMNTAAAAKKAAEVTGLILLPALAMADDGKFWSFMDYKFLPFLGILIGLAPLLILRVLIRKAQGKIPNIYYDENGKKHVETFKRPINRGGLIFYIIAQIGLGFIAYKMLIHYL